ncbi:MAG: hypothetical protein HZB38_12600 [Planctomycetes bacterium]|nr:hypothetical protein [Planctomycetota bacterium]
MTRIRTILAGLAAFLIGVPLTAKAMGQGFGIVSSSLNLGLAIADASSGS